MSKGFAALCLAALVVLAGCTSVPDADGPSAAEGPDAQADESTSLAPADPDPEPTDEPEPTQSANRTASPTATPTPVQNRSDDDDPGPEPVVVAVLDTGIHAGHEAFGEDQVVAWYDFGRDGGPEHPQVLWDERVEPYDEDGHGTAVASLVGGQGQHTPSHAPGVKLAVAKVSGEGGGAAWSDVARAMQWATDVAEADVISLSFYAYLPQSGAGHPLLAALEEARAKDVLPVVLAGNGMDNFGLPTMSWLHPPATSRHSLVVGGADEAGTPVAPMGSMDPEVTALYYTRIACPGSDTCYDDWSGTSFSTPLVAGMAARLVEVARADGLAEPSADELEALLMGSAEDTVAPPTLEGHGFLDEEALERAVEHLRAGTEPERDAVNEAYVGTVNDMERQVWGSA